MKRLVILSTLILVWMQLQCQVMVDSIWCKEVKSVYLTRSDIELEQPFIKMTGFGESADQLMLRFDILNPQPQNLRYRIVHCDLDWKKDQLKDNEYINGFAEGEIENHQSSFNTKQDYVNYYQPIPDAWSHFSASGNYILEVYPADNPDSTILTRRFWVFEDNVAIESTTGKVSGGFGNIWRDQEVNINVTPRKNSFLSFTSSYYHVFVQQNRREDLKHLMTSNGYSGESISYQWQSSNVFPGGNHFRYFDLSNLWAAMYHVQRIEQWGGETFAFLAPDEDRSRTVYTQYNSLNGGMKTNIREHNNPQTEADYVWVTFSLPLERPYLNGNIYIVGDLTQWRLDEESRMEWNAQYKTYTKRMLLKQGYYSYQLLFLPTGEREALTATIEGDHYAMTNNYTIYVYYRAPGARYDRLVGLRQIVFTP